MEMKRYSTGFIKQLSITPTCVIISPGGSYSISAPYPTLTTSYIVWQGSSGNIIAGGFEYEYSCEIALNENQLILRYKGEKFNRTIIDMIIFS